EPAVPGAGAVAAGRRDPPRRELRRLGPADAAAEPRLCAGRGLDPARHRPPVRPAPLRSRRIPFLCNNDVHRNPGLRLAVLGGPKLVVLRIRAGGGHHPVQRGQSTPGTEGGRFPLRVEPGSSPPEATPARRVVARDGPKKTRLANLTGEAKNPRV